MSYLYAYVCCCYKLDCSIALLSLGLSHNRIDDDGAKELADMLRENRTLESLSLSANDIGEEGGTTLIAALTQNTGLRTLMLAEVSYRMQYGHWAMQYGYQAMQ